MAVFEGLSHWPYPFLHHIQAGLPALDEFPHALWNRLLHRTVRDLPAHAWGYAPPAGHPSLRRAISSYLGASRGVDCTPEQVVIVSGSQQGIDLTARILLDPGDRAVIEDPGYGGARAEGSSREAGAERGRLRDAQPAHWWLQRVASRENAGGDDQEDE